MLEDLYNKKGWSVERISRFLGVSKQAVRSRMTHLEIPFRARGGSRTTQQRGGDISQEIQKVLDDVLNN